MATRTRTSDGLDWLVERIKLERDSGGVIYITKKNKNGGPQGLEKDGKSLRTGYWINGLQTYPQLRWILVYQRLGKSQGRAWVGNYDKDRLKTKTWPLQDGKVEKRYEFHLTNARGPIAVPMSLHDLIGMPEPRKSAVLLEQSERTKLDRLLSGLKGTFHEAYVDLRDDEDLQSASSSAEAQRLVQARLGQGKFRRDVLGAWGNACAVTGIKTSATLRASHIRAWAKCGSVEDKLNPMNGLPLVASLDALFDKYLISFANDGKMLVSRSVKSSDRKLLGIPQNLVRKLDAEQRAFMQFHRKQFIENDG